MTKAGEAADQPPFWAILLWAVLFIGLPFAVAGLSSRPPPDRSILSGPPAAEATPPKVEAVRILSVAPETARAINAAVPFSTAPVAAASPFRFTGSDAARQRATDCLAAAQIYEAGDDAPGQRAVAQVVLNRVRHPAFPKSVCAVVFQGSERTTGCQFTFTCDGSLARTIPVAAWDRARALAKQMLAGATAPSVGYATHYHTDWVVPYWSASLDKVAAVGTHLFFRWKGWWGTPPAFRGGSSADEPVIAKLAALFPSHRAPDAPAMAGAASSLSAPDFSDLARPAMSINRDRIGDRFGPGRLAAINSSGDAFVMLLDRTADPASFDQMARQMCGGRNRCRLLGWTRSSAVPSAFPIDEETLQSMSYAYIRITDSGLERSLYNCREYPDQPRTRCMRDRTPAPTRTGTETIRLTPQAGTPPPATP